MTRQPLLWIILLALKVCSCQTLQSNTNVNKTKLIKIDTNYSFKNIKEKYDALIPIFDGLFITHNKRKWGVIDSNGYEIVPFKCDGIKQISEKEGVASLYTNSHSLNTSEPGYKYFGNYFFFTKNGRTEKKGQEFELLREMLSDFHNEKFVIKSGPYYYLPDIKEIK